MWKKSDMRAAQQRVTTALYESDSLLAVVPMGGGKTCSSMTAIEELIADKVKQCALVLAPKRVCQLVWMKEHKEWEHLQHLKIVHVKGTPTERQRILLEEDADIYVVGIDNTQWLCSVLAKLPKNHKLYNILCIDEISRYKNPRGKRVKELDRLIDFFETVWGLTGTPRPNGYIDLYRPVKIVSRKQMWRKAFDKWRMQRFEPENPFDLKSTTWKIRPEWEARTIRDASKYMVTIRDEDMPELPPFQPVYHWVDLPPSVMKQYRSMERDLVVGNLEKGNVLAANQAVASGKLSQIAQGFIYHENGETEWLHSEKHDQFLDLVEGAADEPVLFSYEYRADLDAIKNMFPGLPYFGSGVTDKQAEAHERDWNKREIPLLGLHPKSAGHGLNLQKGGSQMILLGLPWSAEEYDQMLKRFWRPGQTRKCFGHYIFARGTVDEIKYERVHLKIDEQTAFRNYLKRL
jgi:hypothetical protein